jgi:exodeoxyribonuclease V alpha subunit
MQAEEIVMWLEQLRKAHIIDASAYSMGCFINQYNESASDWPGILCALSMQAIKLGHTCLDCSRISEQFPALLNYPDFLDSIDIAALANNAQIGQNQLQAGSLFTFNQSHLFSNKFLDLEMRLLRAIDARIDSLDCSDYTNRAEQLAQLCLLKPLCFLSGGPGTGKTTCLTHALPRWVELFQQKFNRLPSIILCAPTGKAAARMSAAWCEQKQHLSAQANVSSIHHCIPEQAITVHRLLAINPLSKQSKYSQETPLSIDLLVVDESSMIDLPLFVQLFEALPIQTHVLLIGDSNQLPAIEAGNILGSLLDADSVLAYFSHLQRAHLHLDINYRQKNHPGLSRLAQDCLLASPSLVINSLSINEYTDVVWQENTPQVLSNAIKTAVQYYAPIALYRHADSALQAAKNFCLLTAVREGPYGSRTINNEIMQKLNPQMHIFFHGQLLLITENARHLGLANGDLLIIWRQANQQLMGCFESNGSIQTLELAALPAFEPAYALTIHKSQGSEYAHVMVVLPELDSPVLSKSLLYTGFTRAKNTLQILASRHILISSLNKLNRRINGLELLAEQLMEQKVQ